MDRLDATIKNYLESRLASGLGVRQPAGYPEAADFYLFLTNALEGEALGRMLEHLRRHPQDQAFVTRTRQILDNLNEAENEAALGAHLVKKAKSLVSQKTAQNSRHVLWLAAAAVFFALSFVFSHYFLQFLVLALLAGMKWMVDEKAAKTQILIYKALSRENEIEKEIGSKNRNNIRDGGI